MFLSKILRISSPSQPVIRGRLSAILALLTIIITFGIARPSAAQTGWAMLDMSASYRFSEQLDFRIELQTDQAIDDAILFYGRQGARIVRRVYPEFSSGPHIEIMHTEPLERGQFAPGTIIEYWWRFELASGENIETGIETLLYTDHNQDWQMVSSKQFDLHYYGQGRAQAETLTDTAHVALGRIREETGVPLTDRVQVYVYQHAIDMRDALGMRSDTYDARVTTLGVVVDERTLLLLGSDPDIERTLAHELSHIVVGLATANPYAGIPRWLDEGLAMIAEGDLKARNQRALERAIADDTLLSVRSMTSYSGRAKEVDLFYGSSYSVVSFLLEMYGRERMSELLHIFSEGTQQNMALRRVYGLDLEQLDIQWRASLGLPPRALPQDTSPQVIFETASWGTRRAA